MKSKVLLILAGLIIGGTMNLEANNTVKNADVPIKKVTLYSSGVGYFEHKGTIENASKLTLPFETSALNDVLKSIIIYDPNTALPVINYPSEETVKRTLASLSIDLNNNPSIEEILNSLRGAEVKIIATREITGKIIGARIKKVKIGDEVAEISSLSILSEGQIQTIKTDEIISYSFTDPKITDDMNRALDLILNSKNSNIKNININLSGDKKRDIEFSYVIAAPVWKATYRFDLAGEKPYLQGWAIVDNVGEMDWDNVELSLVTGKPVSFIQELYAPYHLNRPIIPLSIAGFAQARTYESGMLDTYYVGEDNIEMSKEVLASEINISGRKMMKSPMAFAGNVHQEVTNTRNAGDMFVFTTPKPVTLERQQSAMIPLVQTNFDAKKVSIFDGRNAGYGVSSNPALGVKFKNNSGMKLPAGPITIYDDGTYVGDALLEFLPENAERMISYGDDLSVTGTVSASEAAKTDTVTVVKGVLNISIKHVYEKVYTFKNNSTKDKNIVVEHPIMNNSKLIEPQKYMDKTGTLYRFDVKIKNGSEAKILVKEEVLKLTSTSIANFSKDNLVYYSTNKEISPNIREFFVKAATMYGEMEEIQMKHKEMSDLRENYIKEQDRMRRNIDTVGSTSVQGKEYIIKLTSLDKNIEDVDTKIKETTQKLQDLRKKYNEYIKGLNG